MIGWVDTETTGLEIVGGQDLLLEVAVVVTDDDLNELDHFEHLFRPNSWQWLDRIVSDEVVLAMHTKSGLIGAVLARLREDVEHIDEIDARMESWLGSSHQGHTLTEPGQLVLAGASVAFDRTVLERFLPRSARWFHYRQIDVSSIKELAKRWAPDLAGEVAVEDRPHRALADIRESIDLLRRYRAAGFIGGPGHTAKWVTDPSVVFIGVPGIKATLKAIADEVAASADRLRKEVGRA